MTEKLSVSYLKAGNHYTILFTPSVGYSHRENSILSEIYFQVQYSKHLSGKWHVFTGLQGLSHWLKLKQETDLQSHGRSFQNFRLGLSGDQGWHFGMALDFE